MKLSGIKAHIWQRISAVYLLLYFLFLGLMFFSHKQADSTLSDLLQNLFSPTFILLSLTALILIFVHAWIGLRDIFIDYLPDHKVQFWLKLYRLFLMLVALDLLWLIAKLITVI